MKRLIAILLTSLLPAAVPADAARSFNGTTDRAEATTPAVTAVPLTMCAWFNAAGLAADSRLVTISNVDSATGQSWMILLRTTGQIRARGCDTGTCASATSTGSVTTGGWHHACAVFTSGTSRTPYLDGVASAADTTALSAPTSLDSTIVGGNKFNGSYFDFFNGKLADVGIWNVALTQAEITSLSKGFVSPMVRPGSLVTWLPLFGQDSPELDRRGGLGFALTGTAFADNPPLFFTY